MRIFFTGCLLLLQLYIFCQSDRQKKQRELINTTIDSFLITHYLLNEPIDKNYKSKFKVLEFWASFCGPCLKAVPHLNRLQKEFTNSNIVFLAFTYERPQRVKPILERVKFESIVVSDTSRTTHRLLGVEYNGLIVLPTTVLIDDQNKILWYGRPKKLTKKKLSRFVGDRA